MVSGVSDAALTVGMTGITAVGNIGLELIDIPAGKHFYLTGIYGVATAVGQIVIFDSTAGWEADAAALGLVAKLRFYLSLTGDGATGFVIGPFTSGVWLASDAAVTTGDIADIVVTGYYE